MIKKSVTISFALLAISISILALPDGPLHYSQDYLPEHIEVTNMVDTSRQYFAQKFWVFSIAIACAYILLNPKK